MKKIVYYTYLGTNGTITSTVQLEGIYSIKKYQLIAEEGKALTKDGIILTQGVMVPESEVNLWYEVGQD